MLRGVAQHFGALFEGVAGLLDHALEDGVGCEREQFFVERDVGIHAGFTVDGFQGFAHVHQGQAQLPDFLAADGLRHEADDERLEGVAQLQHVFQARCGHCTVIRLAVDEIGFEHHHAFARHRTHQTEGFQDDDGFTQARTADTQLFGQFTLPRQHFAGAPLTSGQSGPKFFYH
ncbi:hypothetical protein D3C85_1117530 [compost metagenome]